MPDYRDARVEDLLEKMPEFEAQLKALIERVTELEAWRNVWNDLEVDGQGRMYAGRRVGQRKEPADG